MTLAYLAVLIVALGLAYVNGSNDISKGIATLVGSGVSSLRLAVLWGSLWTVVGGLTAAFAAQGLVATFSGKGFLASPIEGAAFPASVAAGALVWILVATRTGLPVSTTHAITGALAGAGIVTQGASALHWNFLAGKVALPLALSPALSIALMYAVFPLLQRGLSRVEGYCVCLERRGALLQPVGGPFMMSGVGTDPLVALEAECASSPAISARVGVVDGLHWTSSALTSFARGLNDTPKIAALGILAAVVFGISGAPFYFAVALAMGAGSLIAGFRVTETLARKVTAMTPVEGVSANLVTALLVGLASLYALPVSTTHVSSGAIIGIGLHRGTRSLHWPTVGRMLLAWAVTLPTAALVSAATIAVLR